VNKGLALLAIWIGVIAAAAAVLPVAQAAAAPPTVFGAGSVNRHPELTFSAQSAFLGTVQIATRPDRATDGGFLVENIDTLDVLTDLELATGFWSSETQIKPGTYWAMLKAAADPTVCFDSITGLFNPACADGYSEPVWFVVPKPSVRWLTSANANRFLHFVDLRLVGRPLGERVGYRVCWRTARGVRRCRASLIFGSDWNSQASDTLLISTRGMSRLTVFRWYVRDRQVAARRVVVR
jgi:hypothetical protein